MAKSLIQKHGELIMIGILVVFFAVSIVTFTVVDKVIPPEEDCKIISGDILGNVECEDE